MNNYSYYNNTPLPAGWEARWVAEQNRYFYINHQTKTTQWEDPRIQAHPQPTPQAAAAESSVSEEVDQALLAKLHKEFPNATKALLSDMLVGCFNNERETREQLADLGFVKDKKSPESRTPSKSISPKPQSSTSSTREMSQAEKNRMINQMAGMFPNAGKDVIEMSLKVVSFDADKGKQLIQAYTQEQAAKAKKKPTSDNSSSSARVGSATSSSSAASSASHSLMPAGLTEASDNRPQAMASSSTSRNNTPLAHPARARNNQPQQFNSAKNVTNNRPKKQTTIIISQPQHKKMTNPQGPAVSITAQKVIAFGPDPNLRSGPDSSLLSTDRIGALGPDIYLRNGPDHSLRSGPNSTYVVGSIGAAGPDKSLRCGAESALLQKDNILLISNV